jgi:hypothetical protein
MADIIQLRRDTAANWTTANTVLANGEPGVELDTQKMKIGDGTTAWTSLGYQIDNGLVAGTDVQAYAAVLQATTASYTTAEETKLAGIATGAEVNPGLATDSVLGLVEKSTSAENQAGTAANKYADVIGVKEMIATHAGASVSYTCSGTPAAGDPASVSAGVASVVSGAPVPVSLGAEGTFEAGVMTVNIGRKSSCYDPTQGKTYKVYVDPDDGYFYVIAGTSNAAGLTTWDTTNRAQISTQAVTAASIAYDVQNARPAIFYSYGTNVRARTISVSGVTITPNTDLSVSTTVGMDQISLVYTGTYNGNTQGHFFAFGRNTSASNAGYRWALRTSGTTMYNNGGTQFETSCDHIDAVTTQDGQAMTILVDSGDASTGKYQNHGWTSNTVSNQGSVYELDQGASDFTRIVYHAASQRVIMTWENPTTGLFLYAMVTAPTVYNGTLAQINWVETLPGMYAHDVTVTALDSQGYFKYFHGIGGGDGKVKSYEINGNFLILRGDQDFNNGNCTDYCTSEDPVIGASIVSYRDISETNKGKSVSVFPAKGNTNAYNFVGFFTEAGTDGNPVNVVTSGTELTQTNLVTDQDYWIDSVGGLQTYPTGFPYAGKARSATSIETGLKEPLRTLWASFETRHTVVTGDPVALGSDSKLSLLRERGVSSARWDSALPNSSTLFNLSNQTWGVEGAVSAIDTINNILLVCGSQYNGSSYPIYAFSFDVSDPDNPVYKNVVYMGASNSVSWTHRQGDLVFAPETGQFMWVGAQTSSMYGRIIETDADGGITMGTSVVFVNGTQINASYRAGYDPVEDKWICTSRNGSYWGIQCTSVGGTNNMTVAWTWTSSGITGYGNGESSICDIAYNTTEGTWAMIAPYSNGQPYTQPFKINSGTKNCTFGGNNQLKAQTSQFQQVAYDPVNEKMCYTWSYPSTGYAVYGASYTLSNNTLTVSEATFDTGQTNNSTTYYCYMYWNESLKRIVFRFNNDSIILLDGAAMQYSFGTSFKFSQSNYAGISGMNGNKPNLCFTDTHVYGTTYLNFANPMYLWTGTYGAASNNLADFTGIVMSPQSPGGKTSVCYGGLISGFTGLTIGSSYAPNGTGQLEAKTGGSAGKAISTTEMVI